MKVSRPTSSPNASDFFNSLCYGVSQGAAERTFDALTGVEFIQEQTELFSKQN
jgi:hypothetical protein